MKRGGAIYVLVHLLVLSSSTPRQRSKAAIDDVSAASAIVLRALALNASSHLAGLVWSRRIKRRPIPPCWDRRRRGTIVPWVGDLAVSVMVGTAGIRIGHCAGLRSGRFRAAGVEDLTAVAGQEGSVAFVHEPVDLVLFAFRSVCGQAFPRVPLSISFHRLSGGHQLFDLRPRVGDIRTSLRFRGTIRVPLSSFDLHCCRARAEPSTSLA